MAGGGGAWKVAYADFVTAMMAFFLVMWITAQSGQVREAIAQHFKGPKDPFKYSKMFNSLSPIGTEKQSRKHYTKSRGFSLSQHPDDPDSIRPRMGTNPQSERGGTGMVVFFDDGAAELDAENENRLKEFLPSIMGKPQKIEIRGHSSGRPLPPDSPYRDNWGLSYARAMAVLRFFEQNGVPPERLRLSQAGRYEPLTLRIDPQWQARNARVEIQMLNELAREVVGNSEANDEG